MRVFLALEVASEARATLDRAVAPIRDRAPDVRWTRPESWHLTVVFLGEIDVTEIGVTRQVGAAVESACAGTPPLTLAFDGAGRFGTRVLWVGVEASPASGLESLASGCREGLAAAGFEVDRVPLTPHVTLARAGRAEVRPRLVRALPHVDASWDARELVLFRSELAPDRPARYEALARWPLTG